MKSAAARTLIALIASLLLACQARPVKPAPAQDGKGSGNAVEGLSETKGTDPRAAFESSGLIGGLSAAPDSPILLIGPSGVPEAGVSISLGGPLSTAAIACRSYPDQEGKGPAHELILASGAKAILPGPALSLVSTGERIVAACADPSAPSGGSILCFKTEGEGEKLSVAWKNQGSPVKRMLSVPGGRVALADEAERLCLFDTASGNQAWGRLLKNPIRDIAYAPGLVLAADGSYLEAFDESTGASLWTAALAAYARSISAGNGVALVLAESGSLSAFSLADGKGIGAAPGPFDSSLRPLCDGDRAIAAMVGGGASEIDVKTGSVLRTWAWSGTTSFLAADSGYLFAGIDGREGRGILVASRTGDPSSSLSSLGSAAFDAPQAVGGTRGGLLLLLLDGSLVLAGKSAEAAAPASVIEPAIKPPDAAGAEIAAALGRFKGPDAADAKEYLRFDLFAQGMPLDTSADFTAFRFQSQSSAKRTFVARPASQGEIVAIYDEEGRELATSIDELASTSSALSYLEKGKTYWIVAGWSQQSQMGRFRLYLK
jgi:hypothetical protein